MKVRDSLNSLLYNVGMIKGRCGINNTLRKYFEPKAEMLSTAVHSCGFLFKNKTSTWT